MLFLPLLLQAQNHQISIDVEMAPDYKLLVRQKIVYYNHSDLALDTVYLQNWANGYRNRWTPLSKRLIENYDKSLYFAKIRDRGYSRIHFLQCDEQSVAYEDLPEANDLVRVVLPKSLPPGESVDIRLDYVVRVPEDRFTRYGRDEQHYNLRYWYITPAVFDGQWHLYSNLNMDDMYMEPADYRVDFRVPLGYTLNTDLKTEVEFQENFVVYRLADKNRLDIEVNVQLENDFSTYRTDDLEIITNLPSKNLTENIKTDVLQRQKDFIESYLGSYPFERMLINNTTYLKNPVYGFNQLPKRMNPFSDIFEWDIKMFKSFVRNFTENTILVDKREDNWLPEGIQIFLMMEYVNRFYPEVKAIGNISKKWGIRNYSISKLDFNGKYPFVYQFSTRKQLDQALTTRADSLSNFNQKIVNAYKSGLGLRYLNAFLQDSIVKQSLRDFYGENALRMTHSDAFGRILLSRTDKDLSWYFGDYLQTNKKMNYVIEDVEQRGDSAQVIIRNKSELTAPITLYGIKEKEVVFKRWIEHVEDRDTVTVFKGDIDRLSLNYEYLYPEDNLRDNWKRLDNKLLNRPLKLRFYRDIEDPVYNQLFYKPYFSYNYYDGFLAGMNLYNQALFKKKWLFNISPVYGFKSHNITGTASFVYEYLPRETSVYRYRAGINGNRSFYDEDLAFNRVTPFFSIEFKRNSLRDVGGRSLVARWVMVDKELPEGVVQSETYKYKVFNIRYGLFQPNIVNDLRYYADFQYESDFTKLSLDIRYRKLTDVRRYLDLRLFFGTFLHNDTDTDFFSFALDRPSDYMFDLNYLGRSEDTGFFSQQIIITDGGFKSMFENQYANRWMLTTNLGIGLWRWLELYADAGLVKNKGQNVQFLYDSGVRLNFIHDFLEVYFPLQSSLGFEPGFSDYGSRIRFVLTLDIERIYNFVKRGFY